MGGARDPAHPWSRTISDSQSLVNKQPSGEASTPVEPDHRWLLRLWVLVALFAVVTAYRSYDVGIPLRDPRGSMFRNRILASVVLFFVLLVVDAVIRTGWRGWTPGRVLATLRTRWTWPRVATALGALLAYHVVYVCYRNLKSWDAFNTVRDDFLIRVDRWLFFGHSPWVLLHDLLGTHTATYVLEVIYESFPTLVSFSFVAALAFSRRLRDGAVFVAAGMWVWILGVGSYYLIPSLGPFASAAADFTRLPHTMITDTQAKYMEQRVHLLTHPAAGDAFASISAFASLHVGFTTTILLMVRYYGLRWPTRLMTLYLVGTMLATVYLGWHFAVDVFAGLVLAWLAVFLGRRMIFWHGEDRPRRRVETG